MEELRNVKVSMSIKTALKIKSAKENTSIRSLVERFLREKLIEEGDLVE